MFNLEKQSAKVAHVNLREEKHGDDPVLACDVKIVADVANDFLTQLAPTLKASLYQAEGEGSSAQPPLIDDGTHLPVLRFPALGPLKWDTKMLAATVTLHGRPKIEMVADVNELRFEPKEGGTVQITFRVQLAPNPDQVGQLGALLGHTVKVTVKPNAAPDTPPDSVE